MKLRLTGSGGKSNELIDNVYNDLMLRDIEQFNETLFAVLESQKDYLTDTELNLYRRGKKLRPLMLMLFARMLTLPDGGLSEKVLKGSAALEMLHVATLIHDDIIDGAKKRRGLPTVNSSRGINEAIIIGDMQFVQSIRAFADTIKVQEDMGLVILVLDTAYDICCGELDEIHTQKNFRDFDMDTLKKRYMKTIDRKTAILFGLACEAGASLAEAGSGDCRRAGFFGRRFGRAFQIMDDILDIIQSDEEAGKIAGTDLANGVLSLPVLYAMEELRKQNDAQKDVLAEIMISGGAADDKQLKEGIEIVKRTSGIERAYSDTRFLIYEAIMYLEYFPKNRYRNALNDLSNYIMNRT